MRKWANIGLILLSLRMIEAAPMDFRKLEIVSNLNNAEYTRNEACIAEGNDKIELSLVLSARIENLFSEIFITPNSRLIMNGDTIPVERLRPWDYFNNQKPLIRWYLILPAKTDTVYRNSALMMTQWAQVRYKEIPIQEWNDRWEVNVSELKNGAQLFPGTVWFKAELAFHGQFIATPGIESRYRIASRDYGGLSDTVFRLSRKGQTGNRFLDNLLMFQNLPFIANPNSWNGYWSDHQTKCWIGGDLRNFIYFAAELAGRPMLEYYGKLPLPPMNAFDITDYYGQEARYEDGFYLMGSTKQVPIDSRYFGPGDFIINRYQIAVMVSDQSRSSTAFIPLPNRCLDGTDLVLMNRGGALELVPLREALGDTIQLIRWRKRW